MQQEIEPPPFLCDPLEHLLGLPLHHDVERHEDRRFQRLRERFDVLLGTVVQVGDREFGPERTKRPCASPSDGLLVGDANNEAFFPFQGNLGIRKYGNHNTISCLGLVDGLFISSDDACCAIINSSSVGTT